jgi:hypothetical protein
MLSATINQSSRLITDELYANEQFEVIDKKDREAIDMDTYNDQMYKLQLEQINANREQIKKQINDTQFDFKQRTEKLKARGLKDQEMQDEQAWNGLKDHWYWGSYAKDVSKTSYSTLDNYNDKLKDSAYEPIKLSNEYQLIGNFIENKNPSSYETITRQSVYESPFRDYIYDVKYDRLLPANGTPPETPNSNINDIEDNTEKINKAFNIKYNIKPEPTPISSSTPEPDMNEGFVSNNSNVDPKLIEIYQKTLPPSEYVNKNTVSYDVEYSYSYLYVLIIVIILFLLFKS